MTDKFEMTPDIIQGCLFYIVGASGAGKGSLIRMVARMAKPRDRIAIATRYINRPASILDPHIELTSREFAAAKAQGRFLFDWSAHGYSYAVGMEIREQVSAGQRILIDGSRAYLQQARQIFPALKVIGIEADFACLPGRLRQRGREAEPAIVERLERNRNLQSRLASVDWHIDNNRGLEQGAQALLAVIRTCEQV